MTGPLAVSNALVAEIALLGGELSQSRMAASTELFERLGVAWKDETTALELGRNGREPGARSRQGGGMANTPRRGRRATGLTRTAGREARGSR